jgi:adenine-specific DNA-methyltransferase
LVKLGSNSNGKRDQRSSRCCFLWEHPKRSVAIIIIRMEDKRSTSLDNVDHQRYQVSSFLQRSQRSTLGQFLTPASVARMMAAQFRELKGEIVLLDPGAGIGSLTVAFVERILKDPSDIKQCFLVAYEIEPMFFMDLEKGLNGCCQQLENTGIKARYEIKKCDFIKHCSRELASPLFSPNTSLFTHAILNPPYKKIHSQSEERYSLKQLGLETVNLYSAFVWLSMLMLKEGGELCAITPRSFCNGTYYRPFRKAFLKQMSLKRLLVFESREEVFSDDDVLQENIIFHAEKQDRKSDTVKISIVSGANEQEVHEVKEVPYVSVVKPHDPEFFICLTSDGIGDLIRQQMEALPNNFNGLGLSLSTGPVIDFRLVSSLTTEVGSNVIPLLYPEAIKSGKIIWPPGSPKKPIGIYKNPETERWLSPDAWYVLVKRFTSKEEKKRIVAAVYQPLNTDFIGIENHLNYFHASGKGLDENLAKGLATFLNSTIVDNYFRQFSGHTQVNVTDLKNIRYPDRDDLVKLGKMVGNKTLLQVEIDNKLQENIPLMVDTLKAVQSNQKLSESLAIMKAISSVKALLNERSALCLLALTDVKSDTAWQAAQRPVLRTVEIMEWIRTHFGKEYAPNTRETIRRFTLHQFIQMGLVIENPDHPGRPINSPNWCYQISENAYELVRQFGLPEWEKARDNFMANTANFLKERHRQMDKIPVRLADGIDIYLTPGGQNELIKEVIVEFCSRFIPGGKLVYVGDAGNKFADGEVRALEQLGIKRDLHGKIPDVIVYDEQKEWLVMIEAVTSHGPVDLKRRNELSSLFSPSGKGLVYVTAFPDRQTMTKYLKVISWETEVWLADNPDHMIHFDGEKYFSPYQSI